MIYPKIVKFKMMEDKNSNLDSQMVKNKVRNFKNPHLADLAYQFYWYYIQ